MSHTDRPVLGIALMLGFCAIAPLADATAKLLGPHLALAQIVFLRFALQAAILLPIVGMTARMLRTPPGVLAIIVLRTLLHILGIGTMIASLLYLPLADAVAIAYVMPFIMMLLGHWFLGEEVGWRRIAASIVGFLGTLLIVQPAFEDVGWPAFLPIAVAFIFAFFMLITRKLAGRVDEIAMQSTSALIALVILAPALLLLQPFDLAMFDWQPVGGQIALLVLLMGVAGTCAHLMMTWAVRYAPTATLAPIQYAEIPAAALVGWAIFADLPGPMATIGILITTSAGLYIILRERATHRALAQTPPPTG